MITYELTKSNGATIVKGTFVEVMRELFDIAKDNGLTSINYNAHEKATEFRFEGDYCCFSILLK